MTNHYTRDGEYSSFEDFLICDKSLERLKDLFPEWYEQGLDLAHEEKGVNRNSMAADWYAKGYIIGYLEAFYKSYSNIMDVTH